MEVVKTCCSERVVLLAQAKPLCRRLDSTVKRLFTFYIYTASIGGVPSSPATQAAPGEPRQHACRPSALVASLACHSSINHNPCQTILIPIHFANAWYVFGLKRKGYFSFQDWYLSGVESNPLGFFMISLLMSPRSSSASIRSFGLPTRHDSTKYIISLI